MEIKDYLKFHREQSGLTQSELAEKIYVTRQAVSKWERGESYPDLENIIVLSDLYDLSIDTLLRGAKYLKKPHPIGVFTPKRRFVIILGLTLGATLFSIFTRNYLLVLYIFVILTLINLLMVKNEGILIRKNGIEVIKGYSYIKQLKLMFQTNYQFDEFSYEDVDTMRIRYIKKVRLSPMDFGADSILLEFEFKDGSIIQEYMDKDSITKLPVIEDFIARKRINVIDKNEIVRHIIEGENLYAAMHSVE